jgi:glycerol-3-phosphate dehydrogenase
VETAHANTVLILGAGIHWAAIARELLLNRVPVCLVDSADIAFGATAKSSRLIHGGLRYLEYGDVKLVRESLIERQRLLDFAPCFVRPLRLFIPVTTNWSGLMRSAVGFLGGRRTPLGTWFNQPAPRGYWPTRIGLQMYDWLAGYDELPASTTQPVGAPETPRVDPTRYTGLLAYSDAQMLHPERFVLALLADAQQIAEEQGVPFAVHTWSEVQIDDEGRVTIAPVSGSLLSDPDTFCEQAETSEVSEDFGSRAGFVPRLIVNATGAWGDLTRRQLGLASHDLFGGTKGSHLITYHAGLRDALQGQAVYAEADDGRLVFVLPFGDGVLVGTTDETFTASPETATVTEAERDYLLRMVQQVFALTLTAADIAVQYSGVRPLPKQAVGANAAVSRDHAVVWEAHREIPVATLVGGKLTTWRAFAEDVCEQVLARWPKPRTSDTKSRVIPGNAPLPDGLAPGPALWQCWADEYGTRIEEVAALWPLFGTRLQQVLADTRGESHAALPDSPLSAAVVRWIIRHEWVTRLEDLVERRLLVVFAERLTRALLVELAACLIAEGRLPATEVTAAIERCGERLRVFYGRNIDAPAQSFTERGASAP